jgi:hypothetical protein
MNFGHAGKCNFSACAVNGNHTSFEPDLTLEGLRLVWAVRHARK